MGPRRNVTFPMFGDGIFNQDGDAWKQSRELLRPQFHFKEYSNLDMFREATDNLLDKIPASGSVIDLQPLFFRLTLDVTTAFLFGESIESLKVPEKTGEQTFADAFNLAQEYIAKRFRLLDLYWLIGGKEFRDACRKVHFFADKIIDRNLSHEANANEENKYVFLRAMAEKTPDRTVLRGQIINILTAGRDTTACLLSWTFFILVRHPRVLDKLKAEISELNGSTDVSRSTLRNMKYLQNVLKESMSRAAAFLVVNS
jgi:cytochrome P450